MTDVMVERKACPGCGSATCKTLVSEPFAGPALRQFLEQHYEGRADPDIVKAFNYEIVRCTSCQLAYQRLVPSGQLLDDIYERWIPQSEKERLHQQYTLDGDYEYWAGQVQFLIRHLRMAPHAIQVFDFGLGWSEWASMAKAFGCQVVGAELSPARIDNARALGIEIISWDAIPQHRFHFINTEQVFEHLVEPLETLRHLASALAPGGLLKISVPDARVALRRLTRVRRFDSLSAADRVPLAPLEHVNCFEYRTLVAMAAKAGLRPLRPGILSIYNSASGWLSPARALKLALRPIYRHWYPKSTFVYFVREPV